MHPVINIFGLTLPSYGLMAALGLIVGFGLFFITRKKYGYSVNTMLTALLYGVIGGFIGAKLLYIIVEADYVFSGSGVFMKILTSGYVFYGGLIGTGLMVALFAKRNGQSLLKLSDSALPCFAIGHGIGRVGCYLAGCCYGCETDSALGVYFPEGGIAPSGVKLLPTQLFEAVFLVLLALALFLVLYKQKNRGLTTAVYLLAYPVWRFIIEFYRTDARGSVGALSTSQFISIFVFALGVFLLIWRRKHRDEEHAE